MSTTKMVVHRLAGDTVPWQRTGKQMIAGARLVPGSLTVTSNMAAPYTIINNYFVFYKGGNFFLTKIIKELKS